MDVSGNLVIPGKETLVCTEYEAYWATESVWTVWKREKAFASAGN
jgi:hypothetical protein